jgi:hypothetical protein
MIEIHLRDEPYGGLSDDYVWIVTEYECGDYDGNGDAVAKHKNGELHYYNLSHCSCYGPFENSYDLFKIYEDNVLSPTVSSEMMEKILELENLNVV